MSIESILSKSKARQVGLVVVETNNLPSGLSRPSPTPNY